MKTFFKKIMGKKSKKCEDSTSSSSSSSESCDESSSSLSSSSSDSCSESSSSSSSSCSSSSSSSSCSDSEVEKKCRRKEKKCKRKIKKEDCDVVKVCCKTKKKKDCDVEKGCCKLKKKKDCDVEKSRCKSKKKKDCDVEKSRCKAKKKKDAEVAATSSSETTGTSNTTVATSSSETTGTSNTSVATSSSESTTTKDTDIETSATSETTDATSGTGWPIFWSVPFGLMWLAIFFFVVLRFATDLPTGLTIADEANNKGHFIAERAENILASYEVIGPKVTGSYPNENLTVALLLSEIAKIIPVLNTTLFTLEAEVQLASGEYIYYDMLNKYQTISNVIVRLSPLASNSTSYLLINTHFDSKTESPGAGDPGTMVVVMLEIMRVIASGNTTLSHPIIFLFNGAEENAVQGAHGFITAHRWAKNCKVLINLDSCGNGGQEIVFRTGDNNRWLMETYKTSAVYPLGTSSVEELYELEIVLAQTDYPILKQYGPLIGLDIAHYRNGYVYHTKFDQRDSIPRGTLQNTGDNMLALAQEFANSPHLEDPSKYANESVVFYDIFSRYLVLYDTTTAARLNYGIAAVAILMKLLSVFLISLHTKVSLVGVTLRSALIFTFHVIGILLGAGLAIGLAIVLDKLEVPLSWFTHQWMIIGLYFCSFIFGYGFPTFLVITFMKGDKVDLSSRIQLILISQLTIVAVTCAVLTFFEIKTAYLFMIATLFYTIALIINTVLTLNWTEYYWFFVVVIFQIPAFMYFTYLAFISFDAFIPMMGLFGDVRNPDLYIAGLAVIFAFLSLGFVVPLINIFRNSILAHIGIFFIAVLFAALALSPLIFPFREETNVERFHFIHTRRVFHEADNTISKNESGYYFDLQDRRQFREIDSDVDTSQMIAMSSQCDQYMFCGLPIFNHNGIKRRDRAQFLPSNDVVLPPVPTLTLISRIDITANSSVQFNFRLDGPAYMGIQIQPMAGSNITDWSFIKDMLIEGYEPPYFIYYTKGKDQSALDFYLMFQKTPGNLALPTFEIGIGGHYISAEYARGIETTAFIESFPSFAYPRAWLASYEKWVY